MSIFVFDSCKKPIPCSICPLLFHPSSRCNTKSRCLSTGRCASTIWVVILAGGCFSFRLHCDKLKSLKKSRLLSKPAQEVRVPVCGVPPHPPFFYIHNFFLFILISFPLKQHLPFVKYPLCCLRPSLHLTHAHARSSCLPYLFPRAASYSCSLHSPPERQNI